MAEFYLTQVPPEEDLRRCREAAENHWPVTVDGQVADGSVVRSFRGLVQAVDDMGEKASPDRRWRVTMLEQTSGLPGNPV